MLCPKGHRKAKGKPCKYCRRESRNRYQRSINGFLIRKFSHFQTREENTRGRVKCLVDKQDFIQWARKDIRFLLLYSRWVRENYHSWYAPSIDRIKDEGHYEFGNIQWMTWWENHSKEMERRHPNVEEQKPIEQAMDTEEDEDLPWM